jgi:polysaccharide pyruvyl transferase WcaK-like protein
MEIKPTNRIKTECITWRWNGNLGDDLIYAAQEEMFSKTLEFGQYIDAPEAVLLGGGTLITKAPHHPDLLTLSKQLPLAIFGTGVGDPFFWGEKYIPEWIEIINNARFVGVRGPLSLERLVEWGISKDHIEWIGDPALYYAREIERKINQRPSIAVNLGITYNQLYGFDEAAVERVVTNVVRRLSKEGCDITLVSVWQPDDLVIDRIKKQVPEVQVEYWYDDYDKALKSIEKFDVVLCEKLHVGVVAACRGIPFVALNYRSKVLDFCMSINWEKFCLSTENLQEEEVMSLMNELFRSNDTYGRVLISDVLKIRERLLNSIPRVVSALQKASTIFI